MVYPVAELLAATSESSLTLVAAVALAAIAAVLLLKSGSKRLDGKEPPRPASTLPVLGNTLDMLSKQRARLFDWFTEQTIIHGGGTWQINVIGRPRSVVVALPEMFEDILKTQVDLFGKGEWLNTSIREFHGRGILAVDGEEWHFQRKTASHLFSMQMMKDVINDVIREKVEILDEVLAAAKSDEPLSFRHLISQFTSDVFVKIAFGVELDCLKRTFQGDDNNAFISAFSYCSQVLQSRLQSPGWLWRLKRFLNIADEKKFKEGITVLNTLIYDIITKSVTAKSAPGSKNTGKDLISLFLESKVNEVTATSWREDSELVQIRDMAMNFVFAGKDTTSNSMSWFIVMMNRYPAIATKIRDEIRAKAPGLMAEKLVAPTMEDLKSLTYLEAAIRENLRLNPPVAVTSRETLEATTLCDGTPVYAGDRVVMSMYTSARLTSVWGDDATEFKPERWFDQTTGELLTFSPFKFQPFLAGPRICIGRNFAMREMKIALAVLMARHEFTTVQDPFSVTYEIALTCPVDGPLMVKAKSLVH